MNGNDAATLRVRHRGEADRPEPYKSQCILIWTSPHVDYNIL